MDRAIAVNRTCRICGCTDDDCAQCIALTGAPCWWIALDICSACDPNAILARMLTRRRLAREAERVA